MKIFNIFENKYKNIFLKNCSNVIILTVSNETDKRTKIEIKKKKNFTVIEQNNNWLLNDL